MSKLIDIEACKEFMQEILLRIDQQSLLEITKSLELKSMFFQNLLSPIKLNNLNEEDLEQIFSKIFVVKRKSKKIFEHYSFLDFKEAFQSLLYGGEAVGLRYQNFQERFDKLPPHWRMDIAGEVLHFTIPEKNWLCCRWLWDANNNTGALPLLKGEDFLLDASSSEKYYLSVGQLIALVRVMAEAKEFDFLNRSLFGTDVFLGCVYVIYAYTVLKIKMTDEFNKVMPGLVEFVCRIMGIYNSRKMTVV